MHKNNKGIAHIAIIIIVMVLIFFAATAGAYYYLKTSKPAMYGYNPQTTTSPSRQATPSSEITTSNDAAVLESELNATSVNSIEKDLNELDASASSL